MKNKSFLKHLLNQINTKLTNVSKILLVIYICSLFIPIPTGTTTDANVMTKLLNIYLGLTLAYGLYVVLFLFAFYIEFISDKPSEKFQFKMLFAFIVITPLISGMIYLIFNITTVIQLLSLVPILLITILYLMDLGKIFTFDFTKVKKIFLKK